MQTKPMRVQAIGWTHFQAPPEVPWSTDADGGQALAEFAGRACYQSWSKPNPATATNAGYLAHILQVGHLSVLEHGTATLYFTGVSRSFTHELIRHRHFSYSQLSQRYVPDEGSVVEPAVIAEDPYLHRVFTEAMATVQGAYRELAHGLERKLAPEPVELWAACDDTATCGFAEHLADGTVLRHKLPADHSVVVQMSSTTASRKQARQAARSVLPNCTETRIVVTGNYRAWRHFIDLRATEAADVEIRNGAILVLNQLLRIAPNVFADYEVDTLADGSLAARSPHQELS